MLGINRASVKWVKRFSDHCGIHYPLASDKSGQVSRLYDVRRPLGLGVSRVTYVIDAQGIIQEAFHNEFAVSSHVETALRALENAGQAPAAPRWDLSDRRIRMLT